MKYQEYIEMLPVPKHLTLNQVQKEQHWVWALIFLRQIILQIVERVGENPASPVHASLTDSINMPDTELETEPEQPPPTPDMCPVIRL